MKVLVIDNYDSFTYNLVQILGIYNCELIVKRNDEITTDEIQKISPDKILISPGPGRPENSKVTLSTIKRFSDKIPILGVCLGHQAIGYSFGGKIIKAKNIMHGKTSKIKHDNKTIFKDVSPNFEATRYHSLIIEKKSLPAELEISSETEDGTIMGLRHKFLPIEGIQFHPESILKTEGNKIIKNWLEL
ncbi:MAG: aminodeoxychorismate/anthranilate synthase component II [Bacteroidetes bacterium]|nr:aminodeoxychorismate/anthranilate synthase component II [Bacteroidota bacterium]